jgi:hypothetical protein
MYFRTCPRGRCFRITRFIEYYLSIGVVANERALPGESFVKAGAGAPPMCNLTRNWASGIPRLIY